MDTFVIETMVSKMKEIRKKGETIEMKNKDKFQRVLLETLDILTKNTDYLNSLKNDYSCCRIMNELNDTILDLEDKLQKLGLIKYCRDRAEKIFATVTEKFNSNYLLIVALVSKKPTIIDNSRDNDKKEFLDQITKLTQKIIDLEEELKRRDKRVVEAPKETFNEGEKRCFEGLIQYLGLQGRVNYEKAVELFKKSKSKKSSHSMVMLARMHEKGEHVEKSYHSAYELYRDAATENNPTALHMIGHYAENKLCESVKEFGDHEEMALEFYKKAEEIGNTDSMVRLGMIQEYGLLKQQVDCEQAVTFYKKAVETDGNSEGYNCLGSLLYKGKYLKQHYAAAFENFLKAATAGSVDAMNNVGICYEYGKGTGMNHSKALNFYQTASDKLHPNGLSNKAILLIKNNINMNKKEFKEAARLLKLSVHLDPRNKDANYHLGNIYENALGVPQNVFLALKYYKKAMKLGHLKGQTKIAIALFNGYPGIVERDDKKALQLLEQSASSNEPDAMNYLALLLEKGTRSVPQDKEKSLEFYKKAHEKGNDYASLNLALMMKTNSVKDDYKEFIHISAKRGNEYAKMLDENLISQEKSQRINKTMKNFK